MDSSKTFDPNQRPSLSEGITTLQTPTTSNSLTGEASSVEPNTTNLRLTMRQKLDAMRETYAQDKQKVEECMAPRPWLNGIAQLCRKSDEKVLSANPGIILPIRDYSILEKVERENRARQRAQSTLNPGDQKDLTTINNTPPPHEPSARLKRPARPDPAGSPPRNTKRPKRAPTHISTSSGSESDSLQEITYRKTISADLRGTPSKPSSHANSTNCQSRCEGDRASQSRRGHTSCIGATVHWARLSCTSRHGTQSLG
jgi:hypothetical protein